MNKNVAIGLLIVVILVGAGFYFSHNNTGVVAPTNGTPTPVTSDTGSTGQNPLVLTPAAPSVATDSNNSAYISTAILNGAVTPNGAATTYWYEYGVTPSFGNQTNPEAVGSGYFATPTPGYISGLKGNTLYYYRLSAKNSFATVNGIMYTFQTNGTPPPPVVKTSVRTSAATDVSRTSATINGQVNPNGAATNYWYEYGTTTGFGFVTQFLATNSGTTFLSVPVAISGLAPMTKYYYRLNAQNQFSTVNGGILSFTTSGPLTTGEPTVQTSNATQVGRTEATFNGHINPNGVDTTYWFEYSNNSTLSSATTTTSGGTLTGTTLQNVVLNITGLQANTKYYYRLVGTNSNGAIKGSILSFTTRK